MALALGLVLGLFHSSDTRSEAISQASLGQSSCLAGGTWSEIMRGLEDSGYVVASSRSDQVIPSDP